MRQLVMAYTIRAMLASEIPLIVDYFHRSDASFLRGMGVDPAKLLPRNEWISLLQNDLECDLPDRSFYYVVWVDDGMPFGHCNINQITYGEQAHMHLHIWERTKRRSGQSVELVLNSLAQFVELFQLSTVYCEPFAENPAPHRVLKRAGFHFLHERFCVPGWINFEQTVKTWSIDRATIEANRALIKG